MCPNQSSAKLYKAVCFTGREHHIDKMWNMYQYFEARNFDLRFVVTNNVYNADNFESPLIKNDRAYTTVYDYLNDETIARIQRNNALSQAHVSNTADTEVGVLAHLDEWKVRHAFRDAIECTELFGEVLKQEQPDIIFLLHEVNFWGKILAFLAWESGIKVVTLQEGSLYTEYHYNETYGRHCSGLVLLAEYCDRLLMWGPMDVDGLASLGFPTEKLVAVGPSHCDHLMDKTVQDHLRAQVRSSLCFTSDEDVVLLTLPAYREYSGDYPATLKAVISWFFNKPQYQLIVKFHPNDRSRYESLLPEAGALDNVRMEITSPLSGLILASDVCLFFGPTTAAYEFVTFKKLCLELCFAYTDTGFDERWFRHPAVGQVSNLSQLSLIEELLTKGQALSSLDSEEIDAATNYLITQLDGKACKRIYDATISLLTTKEHTNSAPSILPYHSLETDCASSRRKSLRISVLIPTYNRVDILRRTLMLFREQSMCPGDFELIVVDDGSTDDTRAMVEGLQNDSPYPLRLLTQANQGPGVARNRAFSASEGEIVLITGDDICPDSDLLWQHYKDHQRIRAEEVAVLGLTDWSPDLLINPLMHFVTNIASWQFGYHQLTPGSFVDWRYFYTSNISLKRSFLEDKELFRSDFIHAAFEDIELGYRLEREFGLKVYYNECAVGYHHHPMSLDSFCLRQEKAGAMENVMWLMHPELIELPNADIPSELHRIKDLIRRVGEKVGNVAGGKLDSLSHHEFSPDSLQPLFESYNALFMLHFLKGKFEHLISNPTCHQRLFSQIQ